MKKIVEVHLHDGRIPERDSASYIIEFSVEENKAVFVWFSRNKHQPVGKFPLTGFEGVHKWEPLCAALATRADKDGWKIGNEVPL